MTNSQLLEQGLKVAQNYDVTTKENSAVVYSISYQKNSKNTKRRISKSKKIQSRFYSKTKGIE